MHEFRKTSAQMIETCGKMRLRMDKSIITAQHTCLKVNRCLPLLNPAGKGMFEQDDDEKGPLRSLSHSSVLWMLPMDAQVDMLPLDEPLSPGGKGVLEQDDEEKGPLT